ncbi:MAG: hypothetical protein LBP40_07625, partial [Campylobacteraceae bacterium]|nr:hypothetical protein [Campylobacteraceae bacterium]
GVKIVAVSAGNAHSLAISDNGTVYATGYNLYGRLGDGTTTQRTSFVPITSLSGVKIVAVSAGNAHSLAISDNGTVYATGYNYYGRLGLGLSNTANVYTFTEVSSLNDKNITAISAGNEHSLAISDESVVYATGYNYYGRLGQNGTTDKNIFEFSASLID